jgi:hypothetical protein
MPEQPDRNRGLTAAELMQKRAAEEAAQREALSVERWNAEHLPLWSPTIRCAIVRNAVAGCLLSRLSHKPSDRYPHPGPPHPLASFLQPCAWLAVLLVPGQRANAGAHRVARCAARREMEQTYANRIPARPSPQHPKSSR